MILDCLSPVWFIALALVAAAVAPALGRTRLPGRGLGLALGSVPAALFLLFATGAPDVFRAAPGSLRTSHPWLPGLGIAWDVWLSPLGLVLALLVTGLGSLIAVYAGDYLGDSPKRGTFFSAFFVFMGAMLGLALTENLVVLFVFWELTSVASYVLIGFYHERDESRLPARDALLVTGAGGVALLAGILFLGEVAGSYRIGELAARSAEIAAHPLYPAIFWCVFAGALTKSAQVPCHFWLPGAMAAPAPVSAFLHSATMVKAGVFLLALIHPVLGGTPLWHYTLMAAGAVTATWAGLVAMVQTDLKRLLAYTTLSTLGTLTLLLGIEHSLAAKAAVVLLIVHALYKGALFMVAGTLEKLTSTRDVRQLGGLMGTMPGLGVSAVLAAASMSGLPPFVGFIAKELLYEVQLESPYVGWPLLASGVVAGAANLVVALRVGVTPFLQQTEDAVPAKRRPGFGLWFGPALLGAASLLFGIFPNTFLGAPVAATVAQIRVEEVGVKLALWHGFSLVLLLSAVTVAAGVAVYLLRHPIHATARRLSEGLGGWTAQAAFRAGFDGFLRLAALAVRAIQNGRLPRYLATILLVALGLSTWALWQGGWDSLPLCPGPFRGDLAASTALVAVAALGSIAARRRMTAILCLGCAGFGLAAVFALSGAPDLAITQILVETLTLALFALALYGLPAMEPPGRRARALPYARVIPRFGLAAAVGTVFTLLALIALEADLGQPVARQIARLSVPEGFGRNVVNVILVDFRALDTLGESAVLAIAALGVAAMFGKSRRSVPAGDRPPPSPVLLASARYTAPAMLAFSLFLLLRGHNEPGGGFIGGLTAAMAAILGQLALPDRGPRVLGLAPGVCIAAGLGLALASGLPGLLAGEPFFSAAWGPEFTLPPVGKIKLGTPLLFDAGIYLTVAGVVLKLYLEMASRGDAHRANPRTAETWT